VKTSWDALGVIDGGTEDGLPAAPASILAVPVLPVIVSEVTSRCLELEVNRSIPFHLPVIALT